MKTKKKVPVTPEYTEHLPNVKDMEETVIYISLKYGVSGHRCLCGCGELTILPLNKREDSEEVKNHGWNMTDTDGKLTFTPSVGNFSGESPYHAHYIITNGIANMV